MPVYVYKCCGDGHQTIDDRMVCPNCGKDGQYDLMATLNPGGDKAHGRVHSVKGLRNYYDENMEVFIRDPAHKQEEMKKRGLVMHPTKSSTYESYDDNKNSDGSQRVTFDDIGRDGFVKTGRSN